MLIQDGIASGLHIGAQVFVSRDGSPVFEFATGESRPGVEMTPETVMLWLSATKPLGAVAIAQLWEKGKLDLDDRVAKFIPKFGVNGKEPITLRHILTHTAGFRSELRWTLDDWETVIARICNSKLETGWIPGRKAGYHVSSSWFILGEIVRCIDGRAFEKYVEEEIFVPLGMSDCWLAITPDHYRTYGDRIGIMYSTETDKPHPQKYDTEEYSTLCRPGASGHGPIRELARFYEMLLNHGTRNGARILSPQTIEALTARHRAGMYDHTFSHVMDWGLGIIPNNNIYGADTVPYSYGKYASPRAFGHSGSQSSCAFADPEHNLVVAWVFNGMCGEEKHNQRQRELNAAIYKDLGLVE